MKPGAVLDAADMLEAPSVRSQLEPVLSFAAGTHVWWQIRDGFSARAFPSTSPHFSVLSACECLCSHSLGLSGWGPERGPVLVLGS